MEPITLDFILNATDGRLSGACYNCRCTHVSSDTRTLRPGSLFIALHGERFDGNAYLETAFQKGAVAAVAERELAGCPVVVVKDAARALRDLAARYRRTLPLQTVGVTGSVGKTSTKEMIAAVLAQKLRVHKNEGNLNNLIGMPMSVFGLDHTHEAGVFEMGMSGFGEIAELSRIAAPSVGVITNIGISHIEKLGSRENILKAKLEIMQGMQPGGTLVLNADNDLLAGVRPHGFRLIRCGFGQTDADYTASDIQQDENGVEFTLRYENNAVCARVPVPGRHNVYNALAAFACGRLFGLSPDEILAGLAAYAPTGWRQKIERRGGVTLVEDCYNASPDSMAAAFDVLRAQPAKRRVAVLGDMLELGGAAREAHLAVGRLAAEQGVDALLCLGEHARLYEEGYCAAGGRESAWFADHGALADALRAMLRDGDAVLFKGSRGMKLETVIARIEERGQMA